MRHEFIEALVRLARLDPKAMLLTGDLGFHVIEPFAEAFPKRFVNVGVSEQNMMGVATGLAEAGYRPFVYSIASFAILRPWEFVRNGPILHHLPVRIVGVGAGWSYGDLGFTHHLDEDLAMARCHPSLTVVSPADADQAVRALETLWEEPGPIYFRLGKESLEPIAGLRGAFEKGKIHIVAEGDGPVLFSHGRVSPEVAVAVELLRKKGIHPRHVICASIQPLASSEILGAIGKASLAVVAEDHFVNGGLGSAVAEAVAESGTRCKVVRLGSREAPDGVYGSGEWMLRRHGVHAQSIAKTVLSLVKNSV